LLIDPLVVNTISQLIDANCLPMPSEHTRAELDAVVEEGELVVRIKHL